MVQKLDSDASPAALEDDADALDLRGTEMLAQLQCLVQLRLLVNASAGGLSIGNSRDARKTNPLNLSMCYAADSCKFKCNLKVSPCAANT